MNETYDGGIELGPSGDYANLHKSSGHTSGHISSQQDEQDQRPDRHR